MTAETIGCSEAERAFLGCLLRLPRSDVLRLADRMDVEDFVDPANRMLLGAAVAVAVAGQDPDPALVVLELRRRGLEHSLASHQGAGLYALEVFQAAGVPAAAGAYLQGVLEHAYRRRVQESAPACSRLLRRTRLRTCTSSSPSRTSYSSRRGAGCGHRLTCRPSPRPRDRAERLRTAPPRARDP